MPRCGCQLYGPAGRCRRLRRRCLMPLPQAQAGHRQRCRPRSGRQQLRRLAVCVVSWHGRLFAAAAWPPAHQAAAAWRCAGLCCRRVSCLHLCSRGGVGGKALRGGNGASRQRAPRRQEWCIMHHAQTRQAGSMSKGLPAGSMTFPRRRGLGQLWSAKQLPNFQRACGGAAAGNRGEAATGACTSKNRHAEEPASLAARGGPTQAACLPLPAPRRAAWNRTRHQEQQPLTAALTRASDQGPVFIVQQQHVLASGMEQRLPGAGRRRDPCRLLGCRCRL